MVAWFLNTRIGQYLSAAVLFIGMVVVVLWRVFAAGQRAERDEQQVAALNNLRNRVKTDDEVSKIPDSALDAELSEWMRDK